MDVFSGFGLRRENLSASGFTLLCFGEASLAVPRFTWRAWLWEKSDCSKLDGRNSWAFRIFPGFAKSCFGPIHRAKPIRRPWATMTSSLRI